MKKKINICLECNKEQLQGHKCQLEGYKEHSGKLAVPRHQKATFERMVIEDNFVFNKSGTQQNGVTITDKGYLKNLENIHKMISKKIKDFKDTNPAGTDIERD